MHQHCAIRNNNAQDVNEQESCSHSSCCCGWYVTLWLYTASHQCQSAIVSTWLK